MVGAASSSENWKLTTPHVVIDAVGRSSIVLPIDFSLSNSEFARHGNDLMIRSLDGVVIAVRGYFANGSHPKLIEYGGTESTTPLAELFTKETLALDEELAQEELAQEELAQEELTKEPLSEEASENIAAFVTDAGIAEEIQGDSPPEFRVVDGDYTTTLQSVPTARAFAAPPLNDATRPDLIVTQTEPTRSLASAEVELAPVPATSTLAPEPSQPEPEPVIVATEPTPEPTPEPVILATEPTPEPTPVPATSTLAPEPSQPEPEPIIVATEPTPEPTPVPPTSTLAPEPTEPEPEPVILAPQLEPEPDRTADTADTDDDEKEDSVVSAGNDSNSQDIADKDDDVDFSGDNDVKDSVFTFQHGDGKVKIDDFDLGDIIRFEGFNSEDIAIENKGNNVKISIVGDKHDSITLSHQHEHDSNSYSITQTDDGSVIVTLDNQ